MAIENLSDTDWGHRRQAIRHDVSIPAQILGSANAKDELVGKDAIENEKSE